MSNEIYSIFAKDLQLALKDLKEDNFQPRRRAVIRALSSLIEAMVDNIWGLLSNFSSKGLKEISVDEAIILKLKLPTLDSTGKIRIKPQILPVIPRFRFAMEKLMKISDPESESAINHEFWTLFEEFVKIRNRIIHPSRHNSVEISDYEILMVEEFSKIITIILNDTLADCLLKVTTKLEQVAGSEHPTLKQTIKSLKYTELSFLKPAGNKKKKGK